MIANHDNTTHNHNHNSHDDIPHDESNIQHKLLLIDIKQQQMRVYQHTHPESPCLRVYDISTAKNGINTQEGSGGTPLGKHIIADKIGADMPMYTVFVGRVPTGERWSPQLHAQAPDRDWILTRVLWLAGCEGGVNQGSNEHGCCDTYQRYIYIHGTPDSEPMGIPRSHGCIRMRNTDIIELFEWVVVGTRVQIVAE